MAQLGDVFRNLEETLSLKVQEQVREIVKPIVATQRLELEELLAKQDGVREERFKKLHDWFAREKEELWEEHQRKLHDFFAKERGELKGEHTKWVQCLFEKERSERREELQKILHEGLEAERCSFMGAVGSLTERMGEQEKEILAMREELWSSLGDFAKNPHAAQRHPAAPQSQSPPQQHQSPTPDPADKGTVADRPDCEAGAGATATAAEVFDRGDCNSQQQQQLQPPSTRARSVSWGSWTEDNSAVATSADASSLLSESHAAVAVSSGTAAPSEASAALSCSAADVDPSVAGTPAEAEGSAVHQSIQSSAADDHHHLSTAAPIATRHLVRHFPWEVAVQHGRPVPRRKGYWRILWSLVATCVVLVVAVFMFFCKYPFITIALLCIIVLWLLYLCGEEPLIQLVMAKANRSRTCNRKWLMLADTLRTVQGLRSSHEKELKIKAILYTICICVVLFNPDVGVLSALFDRFHPPMVVLILAVVLLVTTVLAHFVVQLMHEQDLRRGPSHSEDTPMGNQAVQSKLREIANCLHGRGRRQRRWSQKRIHEILALSDSFMLNELVERMAQSSDCSLERVLQHFTDTVEHASRSELIELLCVHRSPFLSVRSKSALLHTLMVMRLSSCSQAEASVENLLLSAEGDDLSELKCMQDALGNIHSMHKLVFQDVTDEALRNRVLNHFLSEGTTQVAQRTLMESGHFRTLIQQAQRHCCIPKALSFLGLDAEDWPSDGSRNGSIGSRQRGRKWLKIITDMDDTLESSGAKWPAGVDGRYPRHVVYPAVGAFFRELQGDEGVGQLVALSARPHIVGEVVEKRLFKKFKNLVEEQRLHTMPALLTGSVDAGGKFLLSGGDENGMKALAQKKCESFEQYLAMYPEFRIVFVGDNGQADYAVGKMMACQHPYNIEQVFIHEVQAREKTWGYEPGGDEGAEGRIILFEDYITAAMSAMLRASPLITPEGLCRIVYAAIDDFKKISNWQSESQRESEVHRLNKSIQKACKVLKGHGIDTEIELIDADKPRPALAPGNPGTDSDGATADASAPTRADANGWSLFGSFAKGPKATASAAASMVPAPAPAQGCIGAGSQAEAGKSETEAANMEELEGDIGADSAGVAPPTKADAAGRSLFGFGPFSRTAKVASPRQLDTKSGAQDASECTPHLPRAEFSFESVDGCDPIVAAVMQRAEIAERQFAELHARYHEWETQRYELTQVLAERDAELQELRSKIMAQESRAVPLEAAERDDAEKPTPFSPMPPTPAVSEQNAASKVPDAPSPASPSLVAAMFQRTRCGSGVPAPISFDEGGKTRTPPVPLDGRVDEMQSQLGADVAEHALASPPPPAAVLKVVCDVQASSLDPESPQQATSSGNTAKSPQPAAMGPMVASGGGAMSPGTPSRSRSASTEEVAASSEGIVGEAFPLPAVAAFPTAPTSPM